MSNLTAFLAQNALKPENKKIVVSKRFIGEDGNPLEWEIKTITSDKDEQLRKKNTKMMPIPGRKNLRQPTTDFDAYLSDLAVECTVFPNLHDKELQDSYEVMEASALLKKMLLPGEYAEFLKKIQTIHGFDVGIEDLVEEAKN